MSRLHLFKYFFKRELTNKYLGNITGISLVFIQPVITLLIYWFVFGVIFKARIPDAENVGFIVYLAIGFWPWIAFSESVLSAITVLEKNKDLIGKIKMDFKIQVFASVSATFLLNLIGFVCILIILVLFADKFNYISLPLLIFPLFIFYILSLSLALILSSVQVFIKDTQQVFNTIISLWFFLTPIIYSESILPERFKTIIQINPLYTPITFIHSALVTNKPLPWLNMFVLLIVVNILLLVSIKLFNRLSPYFEEFK